MWVMFFHELYNDKEEPLAYFAQYFLAATKITTAALV